MSANPKLPEVRGIDRKQAEKLQNHERRLDRLERKIAPIKAGQIQGAHIENGAITTAKIAAAAITADVIAVGAIFARHMTAGSVTATQILAGSINADHITAGAVQAGHIAANTIQATHIAAGAISTGHLQAGAITAEKILARQITADHLSAVVTLSSMLRTAPSGNRMEIDDAGMRGYRNVSPGVDEEVLRFENLTGSLKVKGIIQATDPLSAIPVTYVTSGNIVSGTIITLDPGGYFRTDPDENNALKISSAGIVGKSGGTTKVDISNATASFTGALFQTTTPGGANRVMMGVEAGGGFTGFRAFASDGVTERVRIDSGSATITGGTFQTATSGSRIVIDSSALKVYASSEAIRVDPTNGMSFDSVSALTLSDMRAVTWKSSLPSGNIVAGVSGVRYTDAGGTWNWAFLQGRSAFSGENCGAVIRAGEVGGDEAFCTAWRQPGAGSNRHRVELSVSQDNSTNKWSATLNHDGTWRTYRSEISTLPGSRLWIGDAAAQSGDDNDKLVVKNNYGISLNGAAYIRFPAGGNGNYLQESWGIYAAGHSNTHGLNAGRHIFSPVSANLGTSGATFLQGHAYLAGAVQYSSDAAHKRGVRALTKGRDGKGRDKVKRLTARRFGFVVNKDTPEEYLDQRIGWIADELARVIPEAVTFPRNRLGEAPLGAYMNDAAILVELVRAVQEQDDEIEALRAEVDGQREALMASAQAAERLAARVATLESHG